MGFNSGEIYFIREKDLETGGLTPLVKIGLVRDHEYRSSYARLLEHQTGNPRPLVLSDEFIVQTDSVDLVETQLHRRLSPTRVSGEWFRFERDDELQHAIAQAHELAEEMNKLRPLFDEAERLESEPDDGSSQVPAQAALDAAKSLLIAKWKLEECDELQYSIHEDLSEAIEIGEDVKGAARSVSRTYRPKFETKRFKDEHPDLYDAFRVSTPYWYQRFTIKSSFRESIDPYEDESTREFIDEIEQISAKMHEVTSPDQAYLLNEQQLQITALEAVADWELAVSEARLKVECGTSLELEGICKWQREEKQRHTFDEVAFVEEHPDLFQEFLSKPATKSYVRVKKTKI